MGLGFVLVLWIVVCTVLAIPLGAGLAWWSRLNSPQGRASWPRALLAACLPFLLIPIGLLWFAGYAVHAEMVRGVDAGIGDNLVVPLGHGYSFCVTDDGEGLIVREPRAGPVVQDVGRLEVAGDLVVDRSSTRAEMDQHLTHSRVL